MYAIFTISSCPLKVICRLIRTLRNYPNTKDFVYLKRVDKNVAEYNPYALRVVPFSDVQHDDVYTLSVHGITYYNKDASADFTDLTRWEREVQLFVALKKLLLWRLFRIWKVKVPWLFSEKSYGGHSCMCQ
jgi:hypothetical protein